MLRPRGLLNGAVWIWAGAPQRAAQDGHDGDPSGSGGVGWAGLTWWELWSALRGETTIKGKSCATFPLLLLYLLDVDLAQAEKLLLPCRST